jgi:putative RecB family exonuclease
VTARAITGHSHLSWSKISCYQQCPRKFAARYVDHLTPDFRSSSMLYGSGVHAGVELYHQARLQGMAVSRGEMMIAFHQAWTDDRDAGVPIQYPQRDSQEKLYELAGKAFDQFLASILAKPEGQTVAVEEYIRGVIDPQLPTLVARVDLVTVADETVHLVDLKTSRSSWDKVKAAEQAAQLAIYRMLAADLLAERGQQVEACFHVLTRHATPRAQMLPVSLSPAVMDSTLSAAGSAWDGIRAEAFDPAPNFLCRACPYRSSCPAFV